jgi:hypothetical protein
VTLSGREEDELEEDGEDAAEGEGLADGGFGEGEAAEGDARVTEEDEDGLWLGG